MYGIHSHFYSLWKSIIFDKCFRFWILLLQCFLFRLFFFCCFIIPFLAVDIDKMQWSMEIMALVNVIRVTYFVSGITCHLHHVLSIRRNTLILSFSFFFFLLLFDGCENTTWLPSHMLLFFFFFFDDERKIVLIILKELALNSRKLRSCCFRERWGCRWIFLGVKLLSF